VPWKDFEASTAPPPDERDPLDFRPVPVRARKDGWTAERQRRFVALLAVGCGPSEAAKAVGLSKQSAFSLRRRKGAESFAAAWDSAVAFAARRRAAARPKGDFARAVEGVLVPRFYRGRLVSVERRVSNGGLIRLLAQLEAWAPMIGDPDHGAPTFDELLDMIAPPPEPPRRRRRRRSADREALDRRFAGRRDGYG
jgi:hypothetical protein